MCHYKQFQGLLQAKAKLQLSPCPNVSFSVEDAEHTTLQSNSFDAILSSSGMPYLNTKIMFKKLHAWLKPGGLLIYNTPEVCCSCFYDAICSHMPSAFACYAATNLARMLDNLVIGCEHLCQEVPAISAKTKLLSRLPIALC